MSQSRTRLFPESAPLRGGSRPLSSGSLAPVFIRMLRAGYSSRKSDHFSAINAYLAQLLHCKMQSVACPMEPRADADS
jgi:hypothetical protein